MKREKKRRKRRSGWTARLFEFPQELTRGGLVMSVYGNSGCMLQGAGEILACRDDCICAAAEFGTVRVEGSELVVRELAPMYLVLTGKVTSITLEERQI